MGVHDLQALAKAMAGQPVELEGQFAILEDKNGERTRERVGVHFGIPNPPMRLGARRQVYAEDAASDRPEPAPVGRTAVIAAYVPARATVYISGRQTASTGEVRFFSTTPLAPDKTNTYEVRIDWTQDGHRCSQTHTVEVRPGETTRLFAKMPIDPGPLTMPPDPPYKGVR